MNRNSAAVADKHDLYQQSVQEPDAQVEIITGLFQARTGRPLVDLREDFGGTAFFSCEFVEGHPARRAWAVDLDPEPLAWGREHNVAPLPSDVASRVTLVQADVTQVGPPEVPPVDAVVALNYSFFLLRTRDQLRAYFRRALEGLRPGGGLVLELAGGPEMQELGPEGTQHEGFIYVWDRVSFDPIHSTARCAIHFAFEDGTSMKDAFVYEWRVWTIAEVREVLAEVGFAASVVYWEGPGEDGQGDRIFTPCEQAPAEEAWIAYVVGWRA